MKELLIVLTVFFVFSISALAQMSTGQGGGMMGGDWGMGYGWGVGIIIVILVVFVVAYMMKRK